MSKAGDWLKGAGDKIVDGGKKAGGAVKSGVQKAADTGAGRAVSKAGQTAGRGIDKGSELAKQGVDKGAQVAGKGVDVVASAANRGVDAGARGAKALGVDADAVDAVAGSTRRGIDRAQAGAHTGVGVQAQLLNQGVDLQAGGVRMGARLAEDPTDAFEVGTAFDAAEGMATSAGTDELGAAAEEGAQAAADEAEVALDGAAKGADQVGLSGMGAHLRSLGDAAGDAPEDIRKELRRARQVILDPLQSELMERAARSALKEHGPAVADMAQTLLSLIEGLGGPDQMRKIVEATVDGEPGGLADQVTVKRLRKAAPKGGAIRSVLTVKRGGGRRGGERT